jgi:CheY-like chemotaxis protein
LIAANARPCAAPDRGGKLAVLLVEDETIVALATQDALEELGCEVVGCAASAAEAEQLAADHAPDVVLMDVRLKGPVDGVEAAIRLRAHHKAPIIFVTGLANGEMRQRMNQVSASAFLLKPFTDDDLRSALVWACGQAMRD